MSRTELESIGEFGIINRIRETVKTYNESSLIGIGDDAALIKPIDNQLIVVSTDMMVEGIHFDLSYSPLQHVGYKIVASNVSDICAMNAIARQITVSIAASNRFSVEAIDALYEGINAACANYKVDIIGGDTTSSPKGLVISVTVIGTANSEKVVKRSGAKEGDIICVTGDLGAAYCGLQLLRREKEVYLADPNMQPELEGKDYVIQRQLKPEARMDVIHEFAEMNLIPTSMIDISDGLASEIMHICTQSELGAVIYENKLPVDQQSIETMSELNLSSTACILNGGEDYELLFTIKQSDFEKIKNHTDITTIGYMTPKNQGVKLATTNDQLIDIKAQGWVHF
ncbi:MAG: thiamine-phosphate kinase [Bacteroidota bacterium]|nr:thiamine-phosphate kinase [Bacteroidota bacterium]